jgi:putative glutamine amidotransferase
MARPVIGICTALERARWGMWDQEAVLLSRSYVEAVQSAGALVLMLAPDQELLSHPEEALDLIDGLVLAGGADIDPASYGEQPHPETLDTVPERDRFEIALVRAAIKRDLPVLGICRGMQLINVAYGGTLLQHLPERFGHHEHLRVPGTFDGADHDVELVEGSLAAQAAGETHHATKSHHHQGVDRLGEGLQISGCSALDGLPEAIEIPSKRFVLGVQWHPEADQTSRVVKAMVAEAERATNGEVSSAQSVPRRLAADAAL